MAVDKNKRVWTSDGVMPLSEWYDQGRLITGGRGAATPADSAYRRKINDRDIRGAAKRAKPKNVIKNMVSNAGKKVLYKLRGR